jgi:hypothetical protein
MHAQNWEKVEVDQGRRINNTRDGDQIRRRWIIVGFRKFLTKMNAVASSSSVLPLDLDESASDDDSLAAKRKKRKRKNSVLYLNEEKRMLLEGVKSFGAGKWAEILAHYNFNNHTNRNLKDLYKTLTKTKRYIFRSHVRNGADTEATRGGDGRRSVLPVRERNDAHLVSDALAKAYRGELPELISTQRMAMEERDAAMARYETN